MRLRARAGQAGAITLAVAAARLAAPLDSEAKGSRRLGGGSSIGRSATVPEKSAPTAGKAAATGDTRAATGDKGAATGDKGAATGDKGAARADKGGFVSSSTHLMLRAGSFSRASARPQAVTAPSGRVHVVLPGPGPAADAGLDPEEQARRAAAKASAEKAAAEQAAAEDRAEAARLSAETERKTRQKASLHAEVEQVLERARNDYPVLRTEQGEPLLRSILARQKVLQAGGLYPSVAMVEAVADHSDALRPRPRMHAAQASEADTTPDYSRTYGACRWVEPYIWSCK
jgi:hypothetical protein